MVTGINYAPRRQLPILLKVIAHVESVIAHVLHVSDPNQLNVQAAPLATTSNPLQLLV